MTKENQSLGGNMEEQECEVLHEETVQNVKKLQKRYFVKYIFFVNIYVFK